MTTFDRHSIVLRAADRDLSARTASLTLDESWSPYAQAEFTIPATPDLLDAIDPRNDVRIVGWFRQDFGESDPVADLSAAWAGKSLADLSAMFAGQFVSSISAPHYRAWNSFGMRAATIRTFDLGVRSRQRGERDAVIVITAASDEALLQDYKLVATAPLTLTHSTLRPMVEYVLSLIGAHLGTEDTVDAPVPAGSAVWKPGVQAWDFLAPFVQQAGMRLWCDERRHWRLSPAQLQRAGSVALSHVGTVTAASDTITRDGEWYDAVVITYTWTDALGATQYAYDTATTPGYSKVLDLTYNVPYPGPGAAQRVLDRANGRGRVLGISAVSDYTVDPGIDATLQLAESPAQSGIVSAVTWRLPQGEMDVSTRGLIDTPESAWVKLPTGQRWMDSPVGGTWANETIGA